MKTEIVAYTSTKLYLFIPISLKLMTLRIVGFGREMGKERRMDRMDKGRERRVRREGMIRKKREIEKGLERGRGRI